MQQQQSHVLHGTVFQSSTISHIELLKDTLLVIQDGIITTRVENLPREKISRCLSSQGFTEEQIGQVCYLNRGQFLIPGFVDTHNHAPQWAQRGLGRGMPILDWLNNLTFRNEAKFEDPEYARRIYNRCVDGFIKQGTTTVSYFGSLHGEATKILAEICFRKGQRALIGKTNMDRNGGPNYVESSAEESLRATTNFIDYVRQLDPKSRLIEPILTPRFAICCTEPLLHGLGELVQQHTDIAIQTHFNEATTEIDATLSLFPDFSNETDLYLHYNLLTPRTILAHCCCSAPASSALDDDYELSRLRSLDVGIAHCPIANTTVGTSTYTAAPIRRMLRDHHFTKIGLGTDSGGGFSATILDAMRHAFIVSNAREMITDGKDEKLSVDECFYIATLGGARVCGVDKKVGTLDVGKEFDACLITTIQHGEGEEEVGETVGIMTMVEDEDDERTILEKFLVSGDDRNITKVFVRGRSIKN